jgi:hypothetical protein
LTNQRLYFIAEAILALLLSTIPFIHAPFGWFETFFHELSHGLVALLSGGRIHSIELNLNGSGACVTSGGMRFLVLFSGYAGSAVWGSLIYLSVNAASARASKAIATTLAIAVLMTGLLWARDLVTILIMTVLVGIFAASYRYGSHQVTRRFIEFVGIYIVLDAIRSPFALFDGRDLGDGSALSDMTLVPEVLWVLIWSALAVACLVLLFVGYGSKR